MWQVHRGERRLSLNTSPHSSAMWIGVTCGRYTEVRGGPLNPSLNTSANTSHSSGMWIGVTCGRYAVVRGGPLNLWDVDWCRLSQSPEVTLCGWRGYKPSINKSPVAGTTEVRDDHLNPSLNTSVNTSPHSSEMWIGVTCGRGARWPSECLREYLSSLQQDVDWCHRCQVFRGE